MKILSCGAGMQSTALALMACENVKNPGKFPCVPVYDLICFCDLGKEPPWVLEQVNFIRNACLDVGIRFEVISSPLYEDYRIYHDKLLEIIERKIKDPDMLELLKVIIKGDGTNAFGLSICDNVEDAKRLTDRGMPIGNLTSQLLANVYLNELDQFCKKVLGIKFYVRYMDDVIILSQSKEELHEIQKRISAFLEEELQLTLNKKTCIRPVSMGIQFVGLHIWSSHRTVRKSTSLRIKRRLKAAARLYAAGTLTYEKYNSTLQSYMGMLKHNDCYRFKMQLLEDVETILNESGVAA